MSRAEHLAQAGPVTRTRAFWALIMYAAVLGLILGLLAVVFIGVVEWIAAEIWTIEGGIGLFEGEPWWVLLLGAFGLAIGVIRRVLKVEATIPDVFRLIEERRVEPRAVPRWLLVAFVSLISGASVGPTAPLGAMGGGVATWISERRGASQEVREVNVLSGMAAAFGGFFSAALVAAMMVIEAARPSSGRRYVMATVPVIVAAIVGFLVFFTLAEGTLMGIYEVAAYEVTPWSFVLAVPLGVFGALVAGSMGATVSFVRRITLPVRQRPIPLGLAGGLALGAIAWALPLTLGTGAQQLAVALDAAPVLGAGMLFLLAYAKILAVAITFGSGFWGGAIFPTIFVGGVTGAAVHELIPAIPEGLAVVCLFAAVPGAGASLPFTLSLLAAFSLTLGSPGEAMPALLAAAISYAIYTGFLDPRRPRATQNGNEQRVDRSDP